jgi:N,N'-diacetyllegionaminate synthase
MKILPVCEIGINHHGDFEKAKRMVHKARDCGATVTKFQYYNPEEVLGLDHPELEYAKSCQFTRAQHEELKGYCDKAGVEYLVSVFNVKDLEWANTICLGHKIASRMNHDVDFIKAVHATGKRTLMSIQKPHERRDFSTFTHMWCVRDYPASKKSSLDFVFDDKHGISSHCPDWTVTLEAVQMGARVFENHLCESKEEKGCDISSSLDFEDYKRLLKYWV